jgi:hypothetical protein
VRPDSRSLACLAAIVAALGLAACGGDDGSDEDAVRETVTRLIDATNDERFRTVCSLLAASEARSIESQGGGPCPQVLEGLPRSTAETRLRIDEVRISDERATVDATAIREDGSRRPQTVRLVKEGDDWRIASVGG